MCCGIVNLHGQGENPIIAASAVCNVPVSLFRDLGAVEVMMPFRMAQLWRALVA
jgi:hypothetical protein